MAESIFVLGPHRCGTSTVSGLLRVLGVDLGPLEEMFGPSVDNPKGYFENIRLNHINVHVLAAFLGDWWCPPAFEPGWESSALLDGLRQEATSHVKRLFENSPLWGFKDPRSCVTFPFWRTVVQCSLRCVIIVRNPLDASLSLRQRNGFTIKQGADLWMTHVKSAVRSSHGLRRHIVIYEELLANFDQECRRLAEFIGITLDNDILQTARAFVEPQLRHHHSSSSETKTHPELPHPARETYMAFRLLSHSSRKGEVDLSILDEISRP